MKHKVIIAIPIAHTWLFNDICLSQLIKFDPGMSDIRVVIVSNSYEWCPSIENMINLSARDDLPFPIEVVKNDRASKWHGTALDYVVEYYDCDYLFTMEPDVLVLSDDWLLWFMHQIGEEKEKPNFSVGHWHGEGFINPSATLYRMQILKDSLSVFRANQDPNMYWGPEFSRSENILAHYDRFLEDVGPFSEKRGWPPGTKLKGSSPSGQMRGPGWYEPAQQLHHFAEENNWDHVSVPCRHDIHPDRAIPVGTFYGEDPDFYLVHLWGGTRALDLLKHLVSDPTVLNNMEFWLKREAEIWKQIVPKEQQEVTLRLIKEKGWFNRLMTEREEAAVRTVMGHYEKGGLIL